MPTWEAPNAFWRQFEKLTPREQAAFTRAVQHMIADMRAGRFRKGLRVKRVQGTADAFEMTWAPDGRATFTYGDQIRTGDPHIVWIAVGGHEILP